MWDAVDLVRNFGGDVSEIDKIYEKGGEYTYRDTIRHLARVNHFYKKLSKVSPSYASEENWLIISKKLDEVIKVRERIYVHLTGEKKPDLDKNGWPTSCHLPLHELGKISPSRNTQKNKKWIIVCYFIVTALLAFLAYLGK